MKIDVAFYSYFKDLTDCESCEIELGEGACIADLQDALEERFPKLVDMRNSTLVAVGVEYQDREYVIQEGDRISLFPPVQGG